MSEAKKTRLTGKAYDIARLSKKSDLLTKRIAKLTEERDGYDKARLALIGTTAVVEAA